MREDDLVARVVRGDCVVLDVRAPGRGIRRGPSGKRGLVAEQLERRLAELPHDNHRGVLPRPLLRARGRAVETLRRHGYDAVRAAEGVEEWRELQLQYLTEPGHPGGHRPKGADQ